MMRTISDFLGKLSVGRKLMLIYLLDLTAVIFISAILLQEKFVSINFTQQQLGGIAYATVVRDTLLQAFFPDKNANKSDSNNRLSDSRRAYDSLLNTTQASLRYQSSLNQLSSLHNELAYGNSASAIVLRGQVLMTGRNLLTAVGNQSKLIMDPDQDSYYVMSLTVLRFPEVLQLVHDTTSFLNTTTPVSGPAWTYELLTLVGRIDAVLLNISTDYTQASVAGTEDVRAVLNQQRQPLESALFKLQNMLQGVALSESPQSMADLAAQQLKVVQTLQSAWSDTTTVLINLLQQRTERLYLRLWFHLGTAFVLLGVILTLVTLVARQIAKPLQQLAKVADEVRRTGNHRLRAHWNSTDEIGRLVHTFNQMLEQLDYTRIEQQELAASAGAVQAQRALVATFPTPMMVTSIPKHEVLHANAAAQQWLRGSTTDPWFKGLESGVRARFFQELADRGEVNEFEVRWMQPQGSLWAVLSARRLQFQGQDALLTAFTPVNSLKQMEQKLELWAKVFEAASEGIIIMDIDQSILSVNKALCRSTQYDYYELLGAKINFLIDMEKNVTNPFSNMQERGFWQGEALVRRRNGKRYPAWVMLSAVREGNSGAMTHLIGITVDITDRKQNEERIQYLAQHDTLTELPNRALCMERLQQALQQAQQTKEQVAVLFIDLDRFKTINDTLGHHIGDGLLKSVSNRLLQAVRSQDTVSRLGGDEFVIIMRNVENVDELRHRVEHRFIPLIRQGHMVEGHELHVSCSVGIAMFPQDGTDIDELMRRADAAMYEAKTSGRDMARFYSLETDRQAQARQTMEQMLRKA